MGLLSLYGIVILFSVYESASQLRNQALGLIIGVASIVFLSRLDFRTFRHLQIPIYILTIVVLALVLREGIGRFSGGSFRQIDLGIFAFHPAEFAKLGVIVCLAGFLARYKGVINDWLLTLGAVAIAVPPMFLIFIEPDYGTALTIGASLAGMLFAAGLRRSVIYTLLLLLVVSVPLVYNFGFKDYHRKRIQVFLHPEKDPLGAGWSVEQSRTAIGSGGPRGQGMFQGRLKELQFVPERRTDFIFSVVGEELGFRGTLLYLALLTLFILRILWTAAKSGNPFGRMLCVGFACMFAFHGWVNVAMTIGLAPVTGLPLPFMSYATNFLIVSFVAVAIIQSVHRFPGEDMLAEMRRTSRRDDSF